MAERQRSASVVDRHPELTKQQMVQKAGARVLLALVSSNSGKKCMEFVNRDWNAVINVRRCTVLKTVPEGLTRANFWGNLSESKCAWRS
jgi:hypothetical protein